MMTKKEKLEFATLVANAVVTALKATSATPISANEGRKSATPNEAPKKKAPSKPPKYSTDIKDYEPKGEKTKKGYTNWNSYNAQRTKFCYAWCTGGKAVGCFENGKRVCTFDQIEDEYAEAKAFFEKKYKYIKKANR